MPARPSRRPAGFVLGVAALAVLTSCTSSPKASPAPVASQSASASRVTPAPPSAPMHTEVTHVGGRLSAQERLAVARAVARTITDYVDAAFLAGDYPRSGFAGSFGAFTSGATLDARRDQALLTNQRLGATTRSVRALRRTAYLSVLAPRTKVAGATAAVDLVFLVERSSGPAERVQLKGRLLMTRQKDGRWAIFGYDVNRSEAPATGAS